MSTSLDLTVSTLTGVGDEMLADTLVRVELTSDNKIVAATLRSVADQLDPPPVRPAGPVYRGGIMDVGVGATPTPGSLIGTAGSTRREVD